MLRDLFSAGFRPFFFLAACNAWASMLPWLAVLGGTEVPTQGWPPHTLHAHEMLYGTVVPVIAGFLLTAVPNWTGTPAVTGGRLVALVALYLAGRVALVVAGPVDPFVVAIVDLAFLPVLAMFVLVPIWRARLFRNVPVVLVLLVLTLANGFIHAGLATGDALMLRTATHAAVYVIVVLMLVIGGRVIPLFTKNALTDRDRASRIGGSRKLDALCFLTAMSTMVIVLVAPASAAVAPLALVAGACVLLRMKGWQSLATRRQPMLWVLHVGHAWIAIGFLCLGLSASLGIGIGAAALHGFTAGAMGTLMLGMMSRVTLGHTGREIEACGKTLLVFALVIAGAVIRIAGGLGPVEFYRGSMLLGGGLFTAAWFVWTVTYAGILFRPRVEEA